MFKKIMKFLLNHYFYFSKPISHKHNVNDSYRKTTSLLVMIIFLYVMHSVKVSGSLHVINIDRHVYKIHQK